VHQVNGEEDAVLIIVSADNRTDSLTNAWVSGDHPTELAESLRVLYVLATRARRLLAIALPDSSHDRVITLLKEKGVPFDSSRPHLENRCREDLR
jgi:superfamily I DNA/RNA helicase